jgi:hypothetical protein
VVGERSPGELREAGNWVVGLEHGFVLPKELRLCVRLIEELHKGSEEGEASPFRTGNDQAQEHGVTEHPEDDRWDRRYRYSEAQSR